jgi:hypothetical protein
MFGLQLGKRGRNAVAIAACRLHRSGERLKERDSMKRLLALSLFMSLASAGQAIAQDVRYNFDNSADFTKFKTYKWVEIKGAGQVNPLVEKQIKDAFDAELAKKGLQKAETNDVDLFVGYQAGMQKEKEYTSYSTGWGYGPGWYGGGWYGGGGGTVSGSTSTIYMGQLALDMYAQAPHTLVFRTVASKELDTEAKPEKQAKNLAKAVAKMLKNYPPEKKDKK